MLAKPTKWLTEKKDTKSSSYTGVVVDNNDPDKIGRLRIRVVEYYGTSNDIPDNELPWINQQPPSFLGDASAFAVPEIGTSVRVTYPASNPYFGYYYGGVLNKATKDNFFDDDYPNSYGFKDSSNNFFKVNKTANTITIGHSSGTTIVINSDGSITINSTNINMTCGTLTVNGITNINGVTTIVGDTSITGITSISGDASITGDCTASGKSLVHHKHTSTTVGTPTSEPL